MTDSLLVGSLLEGIRIDNIIRLNSRSWASFSSVVLESSSWAREQPARLPIDNFLTTKANISFPSGTVVFLVQISHNFDDISLTNPQSAQYGSINIGQDTFVHRVSVKCLSISLAKSDRNVAREEELEPVILRLCRLGHNTSSSTTRTCVVSSSSLLLLFDI